MANKNLKDNRASFWDNSTRSYIVFMGILAWLTASVHGISEILQGNTPTGGFVLTTIGAFSIIPNYLLTGMATLIVALSLVIWTTGYIHKKNGPTVFLILAILLFLVGGGVAQVAFTPIVWAVSTRINKPLAWWRNFLHDNIRKQLADLWPALFAMGSAVLSIGIGIWLILLPPDVTHNVSIINYICWACIAIGFILQLFIIVSGFARDIENHKTIINATQTPR